MTSPLTSVAVLFQDDFTANGQLNPANWDYNHYSNTNNPSYLGQTQMRQVLPNAENGVARIKLDTYNPPPGQPDSYFGSEAITFQDFDVNAGGLAFEGKFSFEGTQGGMITGFFTYEKFAENAVREPHDEIDFEILTTNIPKISTNVFQHQTSGTPLSFAVAGGTGIDHVYRIEWLPSLVRWWVDGNLIREDTQHVPTRPQQLHLNLWGAPQTNPPNGGPWGPSAGDPNGPPITDPSLLIAPNAGANHSYYFNVDYVKVERLSTQLGNAADNTLVGTAANDGMDGGGGNDTMRGGAGDDTMLGGAGNDILNGEQGNDTLYGGTGSNILRGGEGADRFHLADGADTVRDTLAGLTGDQLTGFGANDTVDIEGVLVGRGALQVAQTAGSATIGVGGQSFQLDGDFSGGEFMSVVRGSGTSAHTQVTFVSSLPNLAEGARVDAAAINGIANEPFLTGDGSVRFTLELKSAVSAFANTLGVYKIAADGTISDVHVLFANTLGVAAGAKTVDLGTPANGERIGFFLIEDGFTKYGALPDNLSFVAPGTQTAADIDTGIPPALRSATLGALDRGPVFHSIATLNPGDAAQVLSGAAAGGREQLIGFEDLPSATGDNDFQDVVIGIRVHNDDVSIL